MLCKSMIHCLHQAIQTPNKGNNMENIKTVRVTFAEYADFSVEELQAKLNNAVDNLGNGSFDNAETMDEVWTLKAEIFWRSR